MLGMPHGHSHTIDVSGSRKVQMRGLFGLFVATSILLFTFPCLTESTPPSAWWTASLPFRPTGLTYNADTLWVCGTDEMIARSDDGGKNWQVKHQKPNGELLLKIVFAGEMFGFASGSNGVFLRTSDGGETWTSSNPGASTIKDISFADDRHGMRQTGPTVEMTDDGGAHWTPVAGFNTNSSSEDYFEVLSFVRLDSNRAAVALHQKDRENYFFVTRDAGQTWKSVHLDNTFAGELFSWNSEYWAFGIEYLERQKSGGYSAPVVLHSSDGLNWSHGVSSPAEFSSCTSQGCILYDGAIANLYREKPTFLAVPADGTLQPAWAVAKGSVCVAGAKLKCALAENTATPPSRPSISRPISTVVNESSLFDDCISCTSGSFAVPNTLRFRAVLDVSLDVAKDGTVSHVDVRKAPTPEVENEIQNIIGAWLFEPPRERGVPVERKHNFAFNLGCFAFPGNDQGTCNMLFIPKR
jgi:hypothetical protein